MARSENVSSMDREIMFTEAMLEIRNSVKAQDNIARTQMHISRVLAFATCILALDVVINLLARMHAQMNFPVWFTNAIFIGLVLLLLGLVLLITILMWLLFKSS